MHLRKTLTVGAAVLAAGLLALTATATANTPTGAAISNIAVNGSSASGSVAKAGTWQGGTASFLSGTYGCISGSVNGTVQRGAYTPGTTAMTFPTLAIVCATPLGINANINMKSGCSATVSFSDPNVHTGLTDTGTGSKFNRVDGSLTISPSCSARVSVLGGFCSADVSGIAPAYFDEALPGSGTQTLGINGAGLSLTGQTAGCGGLLSGAINLNDVRFNIPATIDFQ